MQFEKLASKFLGATLVTMTVAVSMIGCAPAEPTDNEIVKDEPAPNPDQSFDAGKFVVPSPALDSASKLANYDHLDPKKEVPTKLLEKAVLYFDANQSRFANKNYISVIDFSKHSKKRRWFVIDMKTGTVWSIHVAHGTGSDKNWDGYPEVFSNVDNSHASSVGFYKIAESYTGKYGYSVRIDGLSTTNSNARDRVIVIHPFKSVKDKDVTQGMTYGCFGVALVNATKLVDMLKGGSMMLVDTSGVR